MDGRIDAARWTRLGRAWHFLSRLIARGVTAETRPLLLAIEPLAALLPEPFDGDQAAAQHYEIFGLNVPARAGLFLEAEGRLSADAHGRLLRAYRHGGSWPPDIDTADALEVEMDYLGGLCQIRAEAFQRGDRETVLRGGLAERRFLNDQVLPWLAPFCEALARQEDALYAAVSGLILECAAEHVAALGLEPDVLPLPPLPDLLADPETRLDDIAARLAAPALAGFLLDRRTLRRMARDLALPAPLADRRTTLASLLRAAAEYEALPALLTALDASTRAAAHAYQQMADDHPALAPWVAAWDTRGRETRTFLSALQAALG